MPKLYLDPEDNLSGHVDSSFDMPSVEGMEGSGGPYICDPCRFYHAHDHCRGYSRDREPCHCECRSKP